MSKNLKNDKKLTVFLVYSLIKAKPFFDIDITSAHNPTNHEKLSFYPEISRFRNYDFFSYQFINKIEPNLIKCLKWVIF